MISYLFSSLFRSFYYRKQTPLKAGVKQMNTCWHILYQDILFSYHILLIVYLILLMVYLSCFRKITQYRFSNANFPSNFHKLAYSYRQVACSIQNQHQFHHTPFSFFREVLSCALNPALITNQTLNIDARMRAKRILGEIISVGSYSESRGIGFVRENVCKYISRMDGVGEPAKEEVILTEGAERAVHLTLHSLIVSSQDAIMIPAPHYPLYSQSIKLNGGSIAHYALDQSKAWEINIDQLEKVAQGLRLSGKNPKAIVIINPGNPTGQTLSSQNIAKVLQFSVNHRLVVIADEVFRENVCKEKSIFRSCRSVLETLSPYIRENCELVSIHSISKGLNMTPGLRGGYFYLHNLSPFVIQQLSKFQTMNGCSNIIGQLMIDLMVNPFEGMSLSTRAAFEAEYSELKESIKRRKLLLAESLQKMQNVSCRNPEEGMYLYPSVKFSPEAVNTAEREGIPVDRFYCHQIQQNTGTALAPGSIFGQPQPVYHFRISPCVVPEKQMPTMLQKLERANLRFHRKYSN